MSIEPIVSTQWLADRLGTDEIVTVDVRWYANKPGAAQEAYEAERIAGAIRLDMDDDLADRSDPGLTRGRHPLPDPRRFVDRLAAVGIGRGTTVIAYDDAWGGIAARLWWMLRWIGHAEVALLDGGIKKWIAENRPVDRGPAPPPMRHAHPIDPHADESMIIPTKQDVLTALSNGVLLLDARSPQRYRGDEEPIDRRAGHIRGALNAPFSANLTDGEIKTLRSPQELRQHYTALGVDNERAVACSCGSGVTACHDILALTLAGFPMPRLYPGSWSEWSLDPTMPIATGPSPE